jgi:Tfp pilus assembly protein PilF
VQSPKDESGGGSIPGRITPTGENMHQTSTSHALGCVILLVLSSVGFSGDNYLDRLDALLNKNKDGWDAIRKEDFKLAIRYFSDAIRKDPKNADAFGGRAYAYQRLMEYDKAIADYTEGMRLDPKTGAYRNRGWCYEDKGDYDNAIKDFTEDIRRGPDTARDSYEARGRIYFQKKEYDKAVKDFTDIIRIEPKWTSAYKRRARCYEAMKEDDKARADYARANKLESRYIKKEIIELESKVAEAEELDAENAKFNSKNKDNPFVTKKPTRNAAALRAQIADLKKKLVDLDGDD